MAGVNNDDVSERLIEAAARLLAEHGPAGLALRRVAAAAGTSTMAVYSRFGDKDQLLAAMRREGFRRLAEHLNRTQPQTDLRSVGRAYRDAAVQSPLLYGLMFGTSAQGVPVGPEDLEAAGATFSPLSDGVRAAVEQGRLVGDPGQIAWHLWTVAHGAVSLELAGQLPPDSDPADAYDRALRLAAAPFLPAAQGRPPAP